MGGSSATIGYWYKLAYHHGLCKGPIDAFLEYRGGKKVAWSGALTASGTININEPQLWGGEKDQGGIVGPLNVMFGEAGQMPNTYLQGVFGNQTAAWRGMTTIAFEGGKFGAMNPYPQQPSYKVRSITKQWDDGVCWYEATAMVPLDGGGTPGTPGSDTYRWAIRHGLGAYAAGSPNGLDWSNASAFSPGAGAEVNVGEYVASVANNGDTYFTHWTEPGAWTSGGNIGATAMLNMRTSLVNGEVWVAKGVAGYAHTPGPGTAWTIGTGRTWLIAGDSDYIIRYAGPQEVFHPDPYWIYAKASNEPDSAFAHVATIPRSGGEGEPRTVFYLDAADAGGGRIALAGCDRGGNTVVFWSSDGFATMNESSMPAGQVGQIRQLLFIGGNEWLAFVNGGTSTAGDSWLLRSTDGLGAFATVDVGIPGTGTINHLFQGNAAVDPATGQTLVIVPIAGTGYLLETGDRSVWDVIPIAFGALSIYRIAPYDPGTPATVGRCAMNPAHMLVYAHTQRDTSREPIETINDASAKAAADWFYSQGFGLCTTRRPEAESPAEFQRRIEKVSACSFTRSLADGLFYIDIANGIYDLGSLPILTDDDVLDFKEIPTVLDNAINSVSVKYFDPARKESVITPPVRALGLIAEFGVIHQTYDYPEIPTGEIAVRVAQRELLASTTPTRAFDLATTRKPYGWRQNTYFRAQLPKRGIADMVCLVGDLQHGSLKSGAIKLAAVQDVYSLPATVYTEVEHGVDTRPDQTPVPITVQRVIEAPYVDVVALLSRADMDALPADVGFLAGVAADPSDSINFEMYVAPSGGAYVDAAGGDFCPTAVVTDAANKTTEVFAISDGVRLSEIVIGAPVLWGDEICVVKGLAGGSITLGRGCADTTPALHDPASRLLFYGDDFAADRTEYTDGETVDVKLLTNTGSRRLDIALATPMAVTFDQRLVRPYPPGDLRITDATTSSASYPTSCAGALTPEWVHRDRVLQANQLVDASMASIGPEVGTTYTVRYYLGGVLEQTEAGITGTAATPYTMSADGLVRVEVESIRDAIPSWQRATAEFNYTVAPGDIRVTDSADTRTTDSGARRTVE